MPDPSAKPPIAHAPISAALIVRDQAAQLDRALSAWAGVLDKLDRPYQLLIVDDGSADDSAKRAEAFAGRHQNVTVLRHDRPLGIGAGIRAALAQAKHPLFFYTAFDYPYKPDDLRKLLEKIDAVDLVNGFRSAVPPPPNVANTRTAFNLAVRILIGLRREPAPGWLGWGPAFYAWVMRVVFGVHLLDTDSAFKLFRRELFDRLPIQSDGPFVHAEIIAKANFMTCWMDEVPIGSRSDAKTEDLLPQIRWADRWRDLRRVLFRPDFGPWPPKSAQLPAEPASAEP